MNSSQENKNTLAGRHGLISMIVTASRPYRRELAAMILLIALCSVCDAVFPLFNRYAIDSFIGRKNLDRLGIFIALYAAVLVIQVISSYISTKVCGKIEV